MKRLLLLRHAKSDWQDPEVDDFDRPLSARGRRAGRLISLSLARRTDPPAVVLCSPARRTRETLALILPALYGVPVVYEPLLYVFDAGPLLNLLRGLQAETASVLVVGHNPALGDLTLALAGPDSDPAALAKARDKFPTGALAELAIGRPWSDLETACARLTAFTCPRDLE
ncbi:phosphohistidine phosphatase [Rhodospirillum rubrum]|uniref:SixA phosphatase family protein n=1 Tax=Rhodospirillum rubrum TaxID=1085 RepID=UPI0019040AE2|nr:histidine phosphatase family protein [Rhodospirillum rubrum]MBK1664132.1 phosphohistidine phosphatase [Rhodospirillum rubrum]MBK1675607.1 phosphohistidine phosphatase [Rhodospirillum rubrum]